MKHIRAAGWALFLLGTGWSAAQGADVLTPSWVYAFNNSFSEGTVPECTPTVVGDKVYISTWGGGAHGLGTIAVKGTNWLSPCTPLYPFSATGLDGVNACGQMQLVNSNLYGMTSYGGNHSMGNIYGYNLSNNTFTSIYSFSGSPTNGYYPKGSLLINGQTFYGTTTFGGVSNLGTVFAYWNGSSPANAERLSILHHFTGGTQDGRWPQGTLVQSGNTLYGLARADGGGGAGVLFRVNTNGSNYAKLYEFGATVSVNGMDPNGSLVLAGNALVGTTEVGGISNKGVVFSYYLGLAPFGQNRLSVLHQFTGQQNDGGLPNGGVILSGAYLYGMASQGGSSNKGVLFRLRTDGKSYTNLLSFTGSPNAVNSGSQPGHHLALWGNALYGTTAQGGLFGNGTFFRVEIPVNPRLYFQNDTGVVAAWSLDNTGTVVGSSQVGAASAWKLRTAGDVDSDGLCDLIFQNATGDAACWFLNPDGTARSVRSWSGLHPWEIKACGDYLGLGHAQLFFQTLAGDTAFWLLNAEGTALGVLPLGNQGAWKLCGAADLDGNGRAELFWQNSSGAIAIWHRNTQGQVTAEVPFGPSMWALCAVTDLDGDGIADLAWQAPDTTLAAWYMRTNSTTRTVKIWPQTGVWKLKAAGR